MDSKQRSFIAISIRFLIATLFLAVVFRFLQLEVQSFLLVMFLLALHITLDPIQIFLKDGPLYGIQ